MTGQDHQSLVSTETEPLLPKISHEENKPQNFANLHENSNSKRWQYPIGVFLAFISGFIFTANNCTIQTMHLDFTEVLIQYTLF